MISILVLLITLFAFIASWAAQMELEGKVLRTGEIYCPWSGKIVHFDSKHASNIEAGDEVTFTLNQMGAPADNVKVTRKAAYKIDISRAFIPTDETKPTHKKQQMSLDENSFDKILESKDNENNDNKITKKPDPILDNLLALGAEPKGTLSVNDLTVDKFFYYKFINKTCLLVVESANPFGVGNIKCCDIISSDPQKYKKQSVTPNNIETYNRNKQNNVMSDEHGTIKFLKPNEIQSNARILSRYFQWKREKMTGNVKNKNRNRNVKKDSELNEKWKKEVAQMNNMNILIDEDVLVQLLEEYGGNMQAVMNSADFLANAGW